MGRKGAFNLKKRIDQKLERLPEEVKCVVTWSREGHHQVTGGEEKSGG